MASCKPRKAHCSMECNEIMQPLFYTHGRVVQATIFCAKLKPHAMHALEAESSENKRENKTKGGQEQFSCGNNHHLKEIQCCV